MEKSDIHQNNEVDEGVERARRIAQEAEFGSRRLSGVEKYIVPCVAAAWSLFQLSLPEILFGFGLCPIHPFGLCYLAGLSELPGI